MLWQLITSSTNQALIAAFSPETLQAVPKILAISTLATTEEKKSAIAYWEQFPLQHSQDVLTWKENIESNPDSTGLPFDSSPLSQKMEISSVDETFVEYAAIDSPELQHDITHQLDNLSTGTISFSASGLGQYSFHRTNIPMLPIQPSAPSPTMAQLPQAASGSSVRGSAADKFGLSKEFQETFLW